ncbi:50S ribosomal protein L29 [Desulfonema magnum]|uniref:Large ribosomal subunit protein uL29 n=1 Tax=Desulfonema magnum TaxID=45655 RepID=A0A975GL41_9BACT|nr:50S ribosomal protein L29 [Desulfonema magnum]QTA85377.1 50S ribosomal protein L29 [Desulfonema magnum]
MKANEVREMSTDEMHRKVLDLKEELFNLRFQHGISQLENPQRMKQIRRDVARLKTIMRNVELETED